MDRTSIRVEFKICSDNMDLSNVTKMMEINPTRSHLKGDPIERMYLIRKDTLWTIETSYKETYDLDDVLPQVFNLISDKADIIKSIKKMYDAEIIINIVVNIRDNEVPALYLHEDFLRFAGEIGARVGFPTYIF